ncbi:fimbrial assembly chaperone [Enterobacter ludwigii]|jgi:fimbrial chaperone protein|uniref:fimbrial biogenesis chaperone n=1 Tax=Enterobacter ludwigii TaxID=299767 RepID=UPI0003D7A986|nr:molecular chaperone [Enterobacter ludwigii]AHE68542.1 fimbrial assembly chaperone [Enterobacter ludwigii]
MKKRRTEALLALCLFCVLPVFSQANAADSSGGVSLGSTRVIFSPGKGDAWITMNNTSTTPFLVQSWVDASSAQSPQDKSQDKKFIVTPPLYRQEQGSTRLRIVPVAAGFDKSKESVFMLNVKTIPVSNKVAKGANIVQFAYLMKIKLFYRPDGLQGKPADAFEKLTFARAGNTLTVNNPTPYFVTFRDLSVGVSKVADVTQMVPPQGSQTYTIPGAGGNVVKYTTINDFGGVTPEKKVSL